MDTIFAEFVGKYCIIRARSAGVFAGEVVAVREEKCLIHNSRRLWYWDGAASLSQLSQEGTKRPQNCKFPCEVPSHLVFEVIEMLPCTEEAKKSIAEVQVWKEI